MKNLVFVIAVLEISMLLGAFNIRANSEYQSVQATPPKSANNFLFGFAPVSAVLQDSVTRWEPVSTANMSFGRMTMYENRNSAKITWQSGQSSPYTTVSDGDNETVIYLSAAPKFDADRWRYLKMSWSEDATIGEIMTMDFYATKNALQKNEFFMEASYEQVK